VCHRTEQERTEWLTALEQAIKETLERRQSYSQSKSQPTKIITVQQCYLSEVILLRNEVLQCSVLLLTFCVSLMNTNMTNMIGNDVRYVLMTWGMYTVGDEYPPIVT
jgi:hypothetical protein